MTVSGFPGGYDTWTTKKERTGTGPGQEGDPVRADHVNRLQSAVANLQEKVGVDTAAYDGTQTVTEHLDYLGDEVGLLKQTLDSIPMIPATANIGDHLVYRSGDWTAEADDGALKVANEAKTAAGTAGTTAQTAQTTASNAQTTASNAQTAASQRAVLPQFAINANHTYATNTAVVMADAGSIGLTRLDAGTAWWIGFRIDGTTQGFVLAGQKGGFVTRSGATPVPRQLAESLIDAVEPDLDGVPAQPLKDAGAPPLLVQENPDPSNGMPAMMVNSDALIALLWSEVRDLRSRVAALENPKNPTS